MTASTQSAAPDQPLLKRRRLTPSERGGRAMRVPPWRWVVLAAALLVVLTGCDWWMAGYSPDGNRSSLDTIIGTANVASLTLKHKFVTTAVPSGCLVYNAASPVVANGIVYVPFSLTAADPFVAPCPAGGGLAAFNAVTGTTLWTRITGIPLGSSLFSAITPAVFYGNVYDMSPDGNLYAFNATTGATVWTVQNAGLGSAPTVANGMVYIGCGCGTVYAFNATTGATVWTRSTGGDAQMSPAVANGMVYVGAVAGAGVFAFNATTGATVWTAPMGSNLSAGSPSVVNGLVYVSPNASGVHALSATTGKPVWSAIPSRLTFGSAVANGIAYTAGLYSGPLYALNATTGQQMWTAPVNSIDMPALANGIVYIGAGALNNPNSALDAFNAATGKLLWTTATGPLSSYDQLNSGPVVANGEVYLGAADGNVYAYGLP